jgi:methyl-accepting chemotaxis protein
MSLGNLKVATRLGLGFGVVLVLMLGMIATGLLYLGDMQAVTVDIDDKVGRVEPVTEMKKAVHANTVQTLEFLLASDDEQRKSLLDQIEANKRTYLQEEEKFGSMIASDKGKALLAKVKQIYPGYLAAIDDALGLVAKGGDLTGSRQKLAEKVKSAANHLLGKLEALVKYQKDLVEKEVARSYEQYLSGRNWMMAQGGLVLLLVITIAFLIARSLLKQLGGEPRYAAEIASRITQGDLTVDVVTGRKDRTSLLFSMKGMRDQLTREVVEVRLAAESILTASRQIAAGNGDLSSRVEEQASSLQETASSMEELTSTVKQNADNAQQANQLAVAASEVAQSGGEMVAQVVETMTLISASSKKIADITSVIDSIAFQTNILALNAAVEAARAGEQGRGFAVVAGEVRNLAQRSAVAAKEIKALIEDSVRKVDSGSALVDKAGKTMGEVVVSVKRVTDLMGEVTAASQEQSAGIDQVNQAVTQMDQVAHQNAALVEETAAAAESLEEQARKLIQVVAVFKVSQNSRAVEREAEPDVNQGGAAASALARTIAHHSQPEPSGSKQGQSTATTPVTTYAAPLLKEERPVPLLGKQLWKTQTAQDEWEAF